MGDPLAERDPLRMLGACVELGSIPVNAMNATTSASMIVLLNGTKLIADLGPEMPSSPSTL